MKTILFYIFVTAQLFTRQPGRRPFVGWIFLQAYSRNSSTSPQSQSSMTAAILRTNCFEKGKPCNLLKNNVRT